MNEIIYPISQNQYNKSLIDLQICGITNIDSSYLIKRQKSPVSCIEYVECGEGTVIADGQQYHIKGGDSYFLQTGQDQHYYSNKSNPWKKYFINLSGKLLESMIDGYGLKYVNYYENLDIKQELTEIIHIAKDSVEDNTIKIIEIINQIFYKMRESTVLNNRDFGQADIMRNYLDKCVTSKFRLEKLCGYVSKSESQTIRIFKDKFGVTPYRYLINRKIDVAKSMLANTNMPIKQIASTLCFADEYYFSNYFKKQILMSPKEYRKSVRN